MVGGWAGLALRRETLRVLRAGKHSVAVRALSRRLGRHAIQPARAWSLRQGTVDSREGKPLMRHAIVWGDIPLTDPDWTSA